MPNVHCPLPFLCFSFWINKSCHSLGSTTLVFARFHDSSIRLTSVIEGKQDILLALNSYALPTKTLNSPSALLNQMKKCSPTILSAQCILICLLSYQQHLSTASENAESKVLSSMPLHQFKKKKKSFVNSLYSLGWDMRDKFSGVYCLHGRKAA